jgi:hypothetical protein
MIDGYHERVRVRFNEWQRCRAALREKSLQLDEAMKQYVSGSAPAPTELQAEVQQLRQQCDVQFTQVLEAMNERTLAGKQ